MQRIFLVTMLSRLVKVPKGSIGSPITPTQEMDDLPDRTGYTRHMALSIAITSTIEGVIADVHDNRRHCLHHEADPVEVELPVEGLMKMLTNFHAHQTPVWEKVMFGHQSSKLVGPPRSTTPPSLIAGPQMSPPARQGVPLRRSSPPQASPASELRSLDSGLQVPATPTVVLSSSFVDLGTTPTNVLPSLLEGEAVGKNLAPTTFTVTQVPSPVSTTELDTLVAMWSPIVASIIRLLARVSSQLRDGSVRQESYGIVACCLQLCRWPSLLAVAIQSFVKSWPHKADSPHKIMLIDLMMTLLNNFAEVPLCAESVLVHEVRFRLAVS
jgi:hypothetical protein